MTNSKFKISTDDILILEAILYRKTYQAQHTWYIKSQSKFNQIFSSFFVLFTIAKRYNKMHCSQSTHQTSIAASFHHILEISAQNGRNAFYFYDNTPTQPYFHLKNKRNIATTTIIYNNMKNTISTDLICNSRGCPYAPAEQIYQFSWAYEHLGTPG